ncbi:MAG: hypothetical protein ACFB01_04425 [Cohaesibacteraceae bacterium]
MKTLALSAAALSLALGSMAAPALADSDDIKVDTYVVEANVAAGTLKLENGMTLDQSIEYFAFPAQAASGDKVRLTFNDENDLQRVTVLR